MLPNIPNLSNIRIPEGHNSYREPKKMNWLQEFFNQEEWRDQSLSQKVGTIFHLIGTKEGRAKLKADYKDGSFNGHITTFEMVDKFNESGDFVERTCEATKSVSIFAREEDE